MSLRLEAIDVEVGGARVLSGLDLDVPDAATTVILGPSGSGKSTLLRVAAGLVTPSAGRVLIDGTDVTGVPPHRRGVGLMFQDDALFPHLDVADNIGFGLRAAGRPARERAARVSELLALVGLPELGHRAVDTLSGGERKRVALARALAPKPRVLLLDEPLGGLDRPLRERLLDELRSLFDTLRVTVVNVTHDAEEAFALADEIAVLRLGRVAQVAPPDRLWASPADDWIARFLGHTNIEQADGAATVLRPEAVTLTPAGNGTWTVVRVERRGMLVRTWVRSDIGRLLESASVALGHPELGARVEVTIDEAGTTTVPVWHDRTP